MEATLLDCQLFYRWQQNKDASAPVILFLHGWGCDSSIFSFIESDFAKSASVLTLDFPGHGKSGEPPEPWGVPEYARQVLALLELLHISQVMVAAHSFGGRVAIELASKHPEKVQKLVITGGAGIRKPISASQLRRQKHYKRCRKCLEALQRFKPMATLAAKWLDQLRKKYGSADYNRLNQNMRRTFVKVISLDLLPQLKDIQAPTLLIWGSEDTETPLWMGQQMEKEIHDAALIVFEGRTHFAFVEEWQRFLIIVKEFFLGGKTA